MLTDDKRREIEERADSWNMLLTHKHELAYDIKLLLAEVDRLEDELFKMTVELGNERGYTPEEMKDKLGLNMVKTEAQDDSDKR